MSLSAGYCEKTFSATSGHELSALQPVVEVLSVEAFWHLDDRRGTTIFKCNISDGVHRIDAYLSTRYNPLVLDERLRRHTIVRLTDVEVIHELHYRWEDFKYSNSTYESWISLSSARIILSLEILAYTRKTIGRPITLQDTSGASSPSSNGPISDGQRPLSHRRDPSLLYEPISRAQALAEEDVDQSVRPPSGLFTMHVLLRSLDQERTRQRDGLLSRRLEKNIL
jgi:hypothetical protein